MSSIQPLAFSTERRLEPGRYRRDGFVPALSFEVGPGWFAVQDVPGFFDIEEAPGTPDVIAVQFARPVGFDDAGALVAAIARRRRELFTGPKTSVEIDGAHGISIVVDAADPDLADGRFVPVFDIGLGPVSIAAGRRLALTLLDTPSGLLAVLIGGSARRWEAAREAAAPVIASIRFDRAGSDDS